jgi:uncharacterized lipoprotein YmbA
MTAMVRRRGLLASAGLTLLAACGSSPTPTLYTLAPVPGTPRPGAPRVIALREISLARYLERPQIVRSTASYQVEMELNDWWGEPLGAMLGRVMVEELSQRLPGSVVLSELGAIGNKPDAMVEINVLRLDTDSDGTAVLRAQVGVTRAATAQAPTAETIEIKAARPSAGVAGEVAALSDAFGQLADRIAARLTGG